MIKAELGTKRTCPSCAARFYDLGKEPIECPKCGTTFIAEAILPSKADQVAQVPPPPPKKKPPVEEEEATADSDTISLEEVEEGDSETADVEDVDLDEGDATIGDDDEDTFLEDEDDDESNVTDIIVGGKGEDEEI